MYRTTLLSVLAILVNFSIAGYVLEDDYSPSTFFDKFDFFTDEDPTHGFVKYVDQGTAQQSGLISTDNDQVYMGVDFKNNAPSGRSSVRITSKKAYDQGLIILDLDHMPASTCGTWPAFWMVGPDWPNNGEIDIIEGVNSQQHNAMALHTGPGCSIANNHAFLGSIQTPNCDVNAPDQSMNAGCSIKTDDQSTYGDGFNSANGGVYATNWKPDSISVYHFDRASIPSDIKSGKPDPSKWGQPLAQFQGTCDIANSFKQLQIVFDITFCGDWAGNVWSSDSTCSAKANTCNDFVSNNPSAFEDSHWKVNSLKVY
ncbi:glycoside hydrolase family 16 protein, partial [Aulographum hederae CBS 113979]